MIIALLLVYTSSVCYGTPNYGNNYGSPYHSSPKGYHSSPKGNYGNHHNCSTIACPTGFQREAETCKCVCTPQTCENGFTQNSRTCQCTVCDGGYSIFNNYCCTGISRNAAQAAEIAFRISSDCANYSGSFFCPQFQFIYSTLKYRATVSTFEQETCLGVSTDNTCTAALLAKGWATKEASNTNCAA